MFIYVTSGSIDVADVSVLNGLSIRTSLSPEQAARALVADGMAKDRGDATGGYIWLDVAELKRRAAPEGDATWLESFDAMIRYAADHGWTDEDGSTVRAHVEVDPAPARRPL